MSTEWVKSSQGQSGLRLVESNEDALVYPSGHLHGGVELDWTRDLNDKIRRDYIDSQGFSEMTGRLGITPDTTVVFYGENTKRPGHPVLVSAPSQVNLFVPEIEDNLPSAWAKYARRRLSL